MMGYYWGNNLGYGTMSFGWVFMILIWVLVIVGLVFLVKSFASGSNGARQQNRALDVLKERYAKGEIDKNEFEEKKKDLI